MELKNVSNKGGIPVSKFIVYKVRKEVTTELSQRAVTPTNALFSREPQFYKRVFPSVGLSVRWSLGPLVRNAFVSAGRDEPANNLFCVYKLVLSLFLLPIFFRFFSREPRLYKRVCRSVGRWVGRPVTAFLGGQK